jgi:Tfp pilus assembly protein PilP
MRMRAPRKAMTAAALALLMGLPAVAQGTPQGRGPAKARGAAAAADAGSAARTQDAAATERAQSDAGPVIEGYQASEESAASGVGLTYDPEGRRDPFISPSELMKFQDVAQCEGEGIACWLITEVNIVGVMARRSGTVALVTGPDGYGATLEAGDNLYDGEVLRVDASKGVVVFRQRVNDPTRIKPYRDIEKTLSTREGGV